MRVSLPLGALLVPLASGVALAQSPATQASGARRAFTPKDWYRVTTLAGAALSPDGSKIAFTVTTVREAQNKRHSEIWMVPAAGGDPVRFTSPSTESSNPRWSDDGKILYFTSDRPGGRGTQWALRMDQPSGEAYQPDRAVPPASQPIMPADKSFTITTDGVGGAGGRGARGGGGGRGGRGAATPDSAESDSANAARANDPYGKMLPMARPPYGAITKPEDPARFDGRQIIEMRYKANGTGFIPGPTGPGRAGQGDGGGRGRGGRGATGNGQPAQIYLTRSGAARVQLTSTVYSHRNVTLSPDGKWIAFIADAQLRPDSVVARDSTARQNARARPDDPDRNDTDIYLLPVAACEAQSPDCKPRRIEYFGDETNVSWSPDSKTIAFVGRPGRFKNAKLFFVSPDGGKPQDVLGAWPFEPGTLEWLHDGMLSMTANTGGSSGLFRIDPSSKKMTTMLGGRRVYKEIQYDKEQSHVVYIATDVSHPTELFIANANGTGEKKLTAFNDKVNNDVAWSDAERFTYKSVGGLEIEAWMMKPYGYDPSKKYPLVLFIHGGPHSAYDEGWFDEFQDLASGGMWVLYTNPRGSSNYNSEFTNSTRGRWGAEDYQDLMKAVDIAAKRSDVDSTRMGVTGGSYGGFMTAWITTKTNRFKAAETDRMISEWTYWYGASDAQTLTEGEFFGKPWENQAMYDSLSPIRHVANVKTPTLLVQSEEDYRAPIGDAELWFMALKKLNVPAEFVRYPRSNHDLSRTGEPWLLVDRLSRLRQWFSYWLVEKPEAASAASGER